jgi:hypothetical protein
LVTALAILPAFAPCFGQNDPSSASQPVLLASRRGGVVEAFSKKTLETVARIRLPGMVESVVSDESGQRLFLALPLKENPHGCCALFALDLWSLDLHFLIEPALGATITQNKVLIQRGNVGVDVFDSSTLIRLPTLEAPERLRMQSSGDGRWLFGTASASVSLFDLRQNRLVWHRTFEQDTNLLGVWAGQRYYLMSANRSAGWLWSVNPDRPVLMDPVPVTITDSFVPECKPLLQNILAVGERLVVYESFGHKLDRRRACPGVPGGFVVVNPKTGAVSNRLATTEHFAQMLTDEDNRYLYGLDVGDLRWKRVRIIKLDSNSGTATAIKDLDDDVWFLNSGAIARVLDGHLDLVARFP